MALAARDWLAAAELGARFADVRLLHAGSRFTIYAGHDTRLERVVAIKVPDGARAGWLADILRSEGAALAALHAHPHVVSCFEQVRLPDGRPALLLERCTGTVADCGPLPLPRVVATGIKLAGALEAAHRAGVLHCAVQPHNVLVTSAGEPVLAGFDECVRTDAAQRRAALHDLGPHTAPELLVGDAPSTASDVYGLASTLYELAAGRAAFRQYAGESPASAIVRLLGGRAQPISAAGVPFELSDLLTWALAADPACRPPSPAWIAEELARVEQQQGWPRTPRHVE